MAKLFLDTTDTSYKVSNSNTTIFGANGTQAVTIDGSLTGIVLDANVERVAFTGTTSDYKYKQVGTDLEVYNAAGTLVTKVGLQDDTNGTELTFANGTVKAQFAPSATGLGLTVGGQTVATTAPATVDVPAASIDVVTYPVTAPTLSVSSVAATATEGSNAVFTVSLSKAVSTATTVKYTLAGVSGATIGSAATDDAKDEAVSGTGVTVDQSTTATEGTLTFAAGATTATITLPVNLDSITETTEGVSLTLSNPSTGTLLNDSGKTATVNFVDAPATTFTLTSTGTGKEVQEGQTITFTVTPNSVVNANTTLVLNVQGKALGAVTSTASAADFEATPALTFAQGSTAAQTITMKVATDTVVEGREAYAVDVIDTTAYATRGNQVTGVITDKLPTLSLSQNVSTVNEGSTVTYTVTSDEAAPTGGITVPFTVGGTATSGTDYTALTASSVTIAAGAKTGTVTLTTIADTATEGDETVIVTLGTVTNASVSDTAKTVTTTISDTSKALGTAEMTLTGATSVDEGSTVTYTVTLGSNATTALSIPYTLTGTATSGTDFTGSTGTISVAAGAKTGTLTLTATADSTTEGAETVTMTLGTVTGFTPAANQGAVTTTINDTSIAVTGTTFTLTTGTDSPAATTGNDTFLGLYNVNSGTVSTFGSADVINGLAGNDTLNVVIENATAAVTFPSATVSNVETVAVRNVSSQAMTADTSSFGSALTEVIADRSTSDTTFTNLASGVALTVNGDSAAANAEVLAQFKSASGATALTLNFTNGTKQTTTGKAINIDPTNATGLTTLNINSTGAANSMGGIDMNATDLTGANGTATVTTVNIAATTNLDVSTDGITGFAGSAATVNVSGAATSVKLGALENAVTTLNAAGLTAGGVTATIGSSVTQKVTGGAGADTITSAGVVLTTGTVDAGAGTDKLILTTAVATDTAGKAAAALYKNFETIQANATVSQDVSIFSGITSVIVNDTSAGTTGLTNLSAAQAAAVTVIAAHSTGAVTIGVKDASTPGQIDTVKITAAPTTANTAIDLTALALSGIEKLELTASTGTAATTLTMTSATDLDSVKLFGTGVASVATGAIAQKINMSLDASGMTAQAAGTTTATLDASLATGSNGIGFVGSAGDDTIKDASGSVDVINGGAGNDSISYIGGAGDTITGGAGGDTVNAGSTTASASSANVFTLKFNAGDSVSVSGATNGYSATATDNVTAIDNSGVWSSGSGGKFTIDTLQDGSAVSFGTTAVTLGTTTTTNAYDFVVYYDAAASAAYVYQDTSGNKVLDAGEFAIKLVGQAADFTTGEFTVSSGNLVYTSA